MMETLKKSMLVGIFIYALALNSIVVSAHCDTMEGPVITAAKNALISGNVNLILIWVQQKDEAAITELFNKTLKIRKVNSEVQEFADRNFFENLVRIHREGEGAPYTGIKESGEVEPAIAEADKALESGNLDGVIKMLNSSVNDGVKEKFDAMMAKKNYDKNNVAAGREFVESYVVFIHYVEGIYNATTTIAEHHNEPEVAEGYENHSATNVAEHKQHVALGSSGYILHILIIVSTILIITVQLLTARKN